MLDDFFGADPALAALLGRVLAPDDLGRAVPWLAGLGAQAAGEIDALAVLADKNPPVLEQWDRQGHRVDRVVHHPAFQRLNAIAFEQHGLASISHRGAPERGWTTAVPAAVKYALCYEFVQAEFGLFCPISMTDSAARLLRLHGGDATSEYLEQLTSTDPETRVTGAMFMTEEHAGSDVGQTATVASRRDGHWYVSGRKWFCSNPKAEVILTLARRPDGGDGTRGLGLFLIPRHRPNGEPNGVRIDRLKDKLGARSFASAEVTLEDCYAIPVGPPERGFVTMTEMVNSSRLSNAVRSAGLMRRAVSEAVAHTRTRYAFGAPLADAPLMRQTLVPLVVTAEASLALSMLAALTLQRADDGDASAALQTRVLTPLAKLVVTKRARLVTSEAMEVRGGNGYIEDWPEPRLVRDAHLGSIWEGSSNVIALDVLRAARNPDVLDALRALVGGLLGDLDRNQPAVRHLADQIDASVRTCLVRLEDVAQTGNQAAASYVAAELADQLSACMLLNTADREIRAGRGHRVCLVAALLVGQRVGLTALPGSRPDRTGVAVRHFTVLASGGHLDAGPVDELVQEGAA